MHVTRNNVPEVCGRGLKPQARVVYAAVCRLLDVTNLQSPCLHNSERANRRQDH